jgi:hypothetical protein
MLIGLLGLVLSLAIDWFGPGDGRIGASQLLGIQIGILLAVFGASLVFFQAEKRISLNVGAGLEKLYSLPPAFWIMLGFVFVYILLYLFPVFFNSDQRMIYFNRYIPDKYPLGLDLSITMGSVEPWVTTGESPYPKLFYPPLTYIIFAPMALLDYPASYFVITALTLLSYCLLAVLAIYQMGDKRDYSMLALVFVSGLLSYGFQFELERGQFNVITFLLCMLGIHIFWHHPQFRYLAYLLFSIAIHIKLYPAIFILLFINDWHDWKTNLKRVGGLALFNFALLFVLGYRNFIGFMDALLVQLRTPGWSWNGNHSIQAFVFNFLKDGYNLLSEGTLAGLQQNSGLLSMTLLIVILACILAIVIRAYIRRENGFNPYLLLACTLGALIIPTSNDYTLPILVAPIAIFFCMLPSINEFKNRPLAILLLLIISISYSSILYPFKYKPYFLNNSFPQLFLILVAVTLLYFLGKKPGEKYKIQQRTEGLPSASSNNS